VRRLSLGPTGLALIALATLAALAWELDVLRSGTRVVSLYNFDWWNEFLPRHHYAGAALRRGALPLWDAHQIAGLPFLATYQGGVLYPPNALHAFLPTGTALGVLGLLHIALTGCFTYALARELGHSHAGSTLAGLTFMLGGSTLLLILHPNAIHSAPWLPAALLCTSRVLRGAGLRWALLLALCFALQFLAGREYTFVMSAYAVALFAALRAVSLLRDRLGLRTLAARLAPLALAGGLALLLVGAQLLPTLALSAESFRPLSGLDADKLEPYGPLPAGFFFANLVNPARGPLRPPYVGWIPLLCFALGFRLWGRDRAAVYASVLALLAALLCFGSETPLYGAFRMLPLGATFRLPDRFTFLFGLALALGAASGLDRVFAGRSRALAPGALLAVVGSLALMLALANDGFAPGIAQAGSPWSWFTYYGVDHAHYASMGRAAVHAILAGLLLAAGAWLAGTRAALALKLLVLLAAAADLLHALESPVLHPARSPAAASAGASCQREAARIAGPVGRQLSFRLPDSYALKDKDGELFGNPSATHYDPLVTRRHALYFAALQAGGVPMDKSPWRGRSPFMGFLTSYPASDRFALLDLMGTRAILADGRAAARAPALSKLLERFEWRSRCEVAAPLGAIPVDVYENPLALPRAFVVHRVSEAADPEAALRQMTAPGFDPRREAVVEGDFELAGSATSASRVELVSYAERQIVLRVQSPEAGLLVLTDSFDPEWRASAGGEAVPVHPTDALFRGVPVPAGESEVVFRYVPRSFHLGVALSALGVVLWTALWFQPQVRGRPR